MVTAWRHIYGLWGRFWFVPLIPALHAAFMASIGALRPEHVLAALAFAGLGFAVEKTKLLVAAAFPALLVALAYDLMRFVTPVFVRPGRVWGCEMRALELKLFGVGPDTTLPDFFNVHHAPFFDVLFALPYALFIYIAALYSIFLFVKDRERMHHYLWAFAIAHVIGFAIWMAIPAAPPWYIRAHGCVIDPTAAPSAAALLRVDQLLGIHYFEGFYSRNPNSFGAMPSLHCVFPALGLLTAWRSATWLTRPIHVIYLVLMVIASVYLDHHWLIDGTVGIIVAIVAVFIAARLRGRRWP
ncbi:phosphatase PAP2 family protein [Phreatobacter stygius]|uniref:Inositol phosphorylceramide synthase n=1 Tax=Phreatobacter stygius TaxID=1940610 RepID=A0A4D7B054_9HYPH|nr:phosphatase PAP2 family protein [Phreatobacter stygius]QCI66061.1 inositol phosphorylceramide synthase [Phreatobacter stygius]